MAKQYKKHWRYGPTDVWLIRFKAFIEFVSTHGEYPTKSTHPILSKWVSNQRQRYNAENKPLSPLLVELLNEYGFVWENTQEQQWQAMYLRLIKYLKKHKKYPSKKEDKELYHWILRTRKSYCSGKLDKARVLKLDALDFEWDPIGNSWNHKYIKLKTFIEKYGYYPTPEEDKSLNQWVNNQRMKDAKGKLSKKQQKQLNSLSKPWIHHADRSWLAALYDLKSHIKDYGDYPLPKDDGYLNAWVAKQRYKHKKGKLKDWQLNMLYRMDFAWDIGLWRWERWFTVFKNHMDAQKKYPTRQDNYQLWYWVYVQRDLKRKNKIEENRMCRLDQINFDWDMPPSNGSHRKRKSKN